jgi:hypothetical protein
MEQAQLTIADLASIKQIIDAACTRGAFKAAEMKGVGEIYDKLSAFLDSVVAQQKAQEAEQEASKEAEQAQPPQGDQNA